MAKVTPEQQAILALVQAAGDPVPKVLFGTMRQPGIFMGSSHLMKKSAEICLEQKWLEASGEFEGEGRTRKEKYRISPAGILATIERSEPIQLLRQALGTTTALTQSELSIESIRTELLHQQMAILQALQNRQDELQRALQQQRTFIEAALQRWQESLTAQVHAQTSAQVSVSNSLETSSTHSKDWHEEALHFLLTYQARHVQAFCSLGDLYENLVLKHGVTIGQFHDGIRMLVEHGKIRLHPFTGARSALEKEVYALLAEREIMYYAERLAPA